MIAAWGMAAGERRSLAFVDGPDRIPAAAGRPVSCRWEHTV
jgi:hypothetical protein